MGFSVSTEFGQVEINPEANAEDVLALAMHPGIGVFDDYRSIITNIDALAEQAARPGTWLALASRQGQMLGYAIMRVPMFGERWHDLPLMRELFCEVARGCRGGLIIKSLLNSLHQRPELDDLISYLVGYSWHWDLSGSRKSLIEYRQTLVHLVEHFAYKEYPTNEPNVGLRAENLFMARLGANLDTSQKRAFSRLLFGIADDWV